MTEKKKEEALTMRTPFKENQIGKLPKPTKAQTEAVRSNYQNGVRCEECGGWHHPKVIHLDYVGHAALTDRLLDVDPKWYWEPLALKDGLPAFDANGGLWIRLVINEHARLGYGNAPIKTYQEIGAREKEVIGDALRNAAMRFGAALDLWHKGELHVDEDSEVVTTVTPSTKAAPAINKAQPATQPASDKRGELWNMLLEISSGDVNTAGDKLQEATSFKTKDGKLVTGKRDVSRVSDKQLVFLFKNTEREYKKFKSMGGAVPEISSNTPTAPVGNNPPPHSEDDLPF